MERAYFVIEKTFSAPATGIVKLLALVTGQLVRAYVKSDQAMSGGNAVFDVNLNGTSIFSDPDDRPKILSGASIADASGLSIDVDQYTDVISVDFDAFTGTASAVGGKLTVILEFEDGSGGGAGVTLGALVKLTSAQSVSDDEPDPMAIQWDDHGAIVQDDGDFAQIADNIFLIPGGLAGWYTVTYQARWEGNASGQRRLEILVQDDDENVIFKAKKNEVSLGTTDNHYMQVSLTYYLPEGWSVYFRQWQNSGSALDIESTNNETWFSIVPAGKG